MSVYYPEGMILDSAENRSAMTEKGLQGAMTRGDILEATVLRCGRGHDLKVRLGEAEGVIPFSEVSSDGREITAVSRVGKPVCFKVVGREGGTWVLSRKAAMREAMSCLLKDLLPGQVIRARVTHIEPFGAFVDVGCGNVSFIGVENVSVSRISTPSERFRPRQWIWAAVLDIDRSLGRISLTHKELLGTWEQNAARFSAGETVSGVVRGIEEYGVFIELSPNLSGLAEYCPGLCPGTPVSVYIRSIIPEKMKIKLNVIDVLDRPADVAVTSADYFITGGRMDRWRYSPACCPKTMETVFRSVDF